MYYILNILIYVDIILLDNMLQFLLFIVVIICYLNLQCISYIYDLSLY
jgi:hypothetical protein